MAKIAVAFQCDTPNAFSTHSCRAATGIKNVKVVIQNVGKDPEQIWMGVLMNLKLIVEFYIALKGEIYCQYRDKRNMEWLFYSLVSKLNFHLV